MNIPLYAVTLKKPSFLVMAFRFLTSDLGALDFFYFHFKQTNKNKKTRQYNNKSVKLFIVICYFSTVVLFPKQILLSIVITLVPFSV